MPVGNNGAQMGCWEAWPNITASAVAICSTLLSMTTPASPREESRQMIELWLWLRFED